jgi:hypothetical protein
MNNEIAIGILDVYDQEDLENCYSSIPDEYKNNVFIVSATKNTKPKGFQEHPVLDLDGNVTVKYRQYGDVPFATLRNWLITQFRIADYKYYFLLHSNQIVEDSNVFENTIKIAETFGTWMLLGEGKHNVPLEDDEAGVTLYASPEMNSEFIFLISGIVKNVGFFEERFFNTKDLDVLDYIIKLREKGVYPPAHFNPNIGSGIKSTKKTIKKIGFKDFPDQDRSVGLSYGYFVHKHKYIPGQNDPTGVTQEELIKSLENIQKKYAKNN